MEKLLLSLLLIVTLSFGATLKDADIAVKKKDYATAIKISEPLANKGDFEAQGFIAMLYSSLPGDKNIEKAIYWLEIVTERVENNGIKDNDLGYPLFKMLLASLYTKGEYKNYTKALEHYEDICKSKFKVGCEEYQKLKEEIIKSKRELAKRGDVKVQYELAFMYYKGQEVEKNIKESIYWFEQAANQGDIDAQYNLGLIYHNGEVVTQDYYKAYVWYGKACKKGLHKACNKVGVVDFESSMKLAKQGDSEAQCKVGSYYSDGSLMEQDLRTALYWFKKSCDNGYAEGCEEYKAWSSK